MSVEIKLAREMGFCFGVRRAVGMVEKLTADHEQVAILGSLVHNPQVMADLKDKGVVTVASADEVSEGLLVIPSHGAPPRVYERAKAKGLTIVDATCPYVRVAQKAAEELAAANLQVLILGDRMHTEVKGLVGWSGGKARVIGGAADLAEVRLDSGVGILAQTTQTLDAFRAVVETIVDRHLADLKQLRVVNTICTATAARQSAAAELACAVDVVIVIGGRESANTKRLAEICRHAGCEAHQVEDADDVDRAWIAGRGRVGVTAGASTPDDVVRRVVQRIRSLGS